MDTVNVERVKLSVLSESTNDATYEFAVSISGRLDGRDVKELDTQHQSDGLTLVVVYMSVL